jgi:hypothetical protein
VSRHHVEPKTFEEKVSAQLHEAKSQIESIEASAKGKLAQAEIDAISSLKTTRHEIDKKSRELKTAGEARAAQIRAEIEADLAKFNAEVQQFGSKLKGKAATK